MENWNEQDKWWAGRDSYFSGAEMAAMCSADYDGHEGSMGPTYGLKNADSTMKMAIGGLAVMDINYIKEMKLWSDQNRTTGFPADAINFHHYCNSAPGERSYGVSVGISPEDDNLKEKMKVIVEYRNKWLPGLEVWVSEFGYSTHPDSWQASPAIGYNDNEEIQGRWLLRSFLELSAAGVDRAYQYLLVDQSSESSSSYAADGLVKDPWDYNHAYYVWENDSIVDTLYHQHESYQRKKAWFHMSCMKNVMSGFHFYQELASGHQDINLYEFRNEANDSSVFAVWCKTSTNQIVNNFTFNVGTNAYQVVTVTPDSISKTGIKDTLTLNDDSVSLTVSEMPVFVIKINNDPYGPTAKTKNIDVYLDENGQASIQPTDVDGGSTDNNGIVSRSLSKSTFDCSDITSSTTLTVVSDSSWKTSSVASTATYASFPWTGELGNLPHDSTFTNNATLGQPYGYHSIDSIDGANVIKAAHYVTFHRASFQLDQKDGVKARFQCNHDDDIEIYINDSLLLREERFDYNEGRQSPEHDIYFADLIENGFQGGDTFDYVSSAPLSDILVAGTNTITVALRNGGPGNNGGFSLKMTLTQEGTPVTLTVADHVSNTDSAVALVFVHDTLDPVARVEDYILNLDANGEAILTYQDIDNGSGDNCNSISSYILSKTDFDCSDISQTISQTIVSDSSWKVSNVVAPRQFPWDGIDLNEIPHDSTFVNNAEEGQTVGWELVKPIPGTQPLKAWDEVRIFQKKFTINGNGEFQARLQITGDDFFQIILNGVTLALRESAHADNAKLPPHDIFFDKSGTVTNGYDSGDSFDSYYDSAIASVLKAGENTLIVAVSNNFNSSGGFSLKMEVSALSAHPVQLLIEDSNGDKDSATAYVKVVDVIAPSVISRNRSYVLDSTGVLYLNAADLDSNSTDACGITGMSISPDSLVCANHGDNTITLTVIDSSGNIAYGYPVVTLDTTGSNCVLASSKKGRVEGVVIGDNLDHTLNIYPNPVNDQLQIESGSIMEELYIYDLQGKMVDRKRVMARTMLLDVSAYARGMYIVKVIRNGAAQNFEIIKE